MVGSLSRSEFLDRKRDFFHLLVHLTREDEFYDAKGVLECILEETTLRAYNYYCIFNDEINKFDKNLRDIFKVVCFTETPIDQIDVLLEKVDNRQTILEPYGLVFKKEDIHKSGNPVFYVRGDLSDPHWQLFNSALLSGFFKGENKVLALVNKCDETIDFHWEREWRIVGDYKFNLDDVYCGLCQQRDIQYFESKFRPVYFIDPVWGIGKILDKLVGK